VFDFLDNQCPPVSDSILILRSKKTGGIPIGVASGSCFVIGPYLAVTALHVIDDFADAHYSMKTGLGRGVLVTPKLGSFELIASHWDSLTEAWRDFEVDQISLSKFSDFAVLRLKPRFDSSPTKYQWRPLAMHGWPVKIGENVISVGYTSHNKPDRILQAGEVEEIGRYRAKGVVEEIYPKSRDQLIDSPCFLSDMPINGGMSGGPVFSENGLVCGLLSSSIPPGLDSVDGKHSCFSVSLWPLLGDVIELQLPHTTGCRSYSLWQLNQMGYIRMAGVGNVHLKLSKDGQIEAVQNVPSSMTDRSNLTS